MKASFSLTFLLLGASSVLSAFIPSKREYVPSDETCTTLNDNVDDYNGASSPGCSILVKNCRQRVNDLNKWDDPWYFQTCATAAFCHGAENVLDLIKCDHKPETVPDRAHLPAWSKDTYDIMVEYDCPSYECPVTQKEFAINIRNLIDAFGGKDAPLPSEESIGKHYWKPIIDYKSNDNNTVSYEQFDEWLHTGPAV